VTAQASILKVLAAAQEAGVNVGHPTFLYWMFEGARVPELDEWALTLGWRPGQGDTTLYCALVCLPIVGPHEAAKICQAIEAYWK